MAAYGRNIGTRMTGRSVIVVATVFASTGVAIIGGWRIVVDDRDSEMRRPTLTAAEAARIAARLVRGLEAERMSLPVLHCKLATPRQRYWCSSARRLTAAVVAAEMLTPRSGSHRTTRCLMKSEEGDLWTIDVAAGRRCFLR
jgi:hypothetical protein